MLDFAGPSLSFRLGLFCAAALAAGCGHPTVDAHELEATLRVDGKESHAVLAFPDHDAVEHHTKGDSSCKLFSGNCGSDSPSHATIIGDTPIRGAAMTTLDDATSITYDIDVERDPDDPENAKDDGRPPFANYALCRVYDSELGTPQRCFYTGKEMTLTLRRR